MDTTTATNLQSYMKQNAPDLVKKVGEYNKENETLKELTIQRDDRLKNIIKEHPGMSKGAAMVLAATENENLNEEIRSRANALETMQADIKYQTDIINADFLSQQKREETRQAQEYQAGLIKDERAYNAEQKQADREYNSINAQLEFAQANGIPMVRSDANVILADAKKYAEENGVSIEQAIKDTFTTPFTSKKEYATALQAIRNKNSGAITPYEQAQLDIKREEMRQGKSINVQKIGENRY